LDDAGDHFTETVWVDLTASITQAKHPRGPIIGSMQRTSYLRY
jgi:hypothetical protein